MSPVFTMVLGLLRPGDAPAVSEDQPALDHDAFTGFFAANVSGFRIELASAAFLIGTFDAGFVRAGGFGGIMHILEGRGRAVRGGHELQLGLGSSGGLGIGLHRDHGGRRYGRGHGDVFEEISTVHQSLAHGGAPYFLQLGLQGSRSFKAYVLCVAVAMQPIVAERLHLAEGARLQDVA